MALFAGTGGFIVVDGSPDVTLQVADYSVEFGDRLADGTTSAHTGSNYESTLEENRWTINLPVDAAATPSAAGLTPGAKVSIWFKVPSPTPTYHKLTSTSVAQVGVQNPNTGELHRNAISGQGGTRTLYGAAPS